jgi:hypothetical protein
MIAANFVGGMTSHIDLGGTGRPVVGKLQPPEGFNERVLWNFALVSVQSISPETRETSPYITASVDRDGRFRLDDVPAGHYSLSVRFDTGPGRAAGRLFNHRFEVPSLEGDLAVQPVDLGTLRLEK